MSKLRRKFPNYNSFIIVVGIILIWRGVWHLADTYLLPDNPVLSSVIGILIGLFILLVDDLRLDELHESVPLPEDELLPEIKKDEEK